MAREINLEFTLKAKFMELKDYTTEELRAELNLANSLKQKNGKNYRCHNATQLACEYFERKEN